MRRRLDPPAARITLMTPNVVHLNTQKMPNTVRHKGMRETAFDEFTFSDFSDAMFD
jgi:hypothetical protein